MKAWESFSKTGGISIIGILILALLPDRYKQGKLDLPGVMTPGTLPPPPYAPTAPASSAITEEQIPTTQK